MTNSMNRNYKNKPFFGFYSGFSHHFKISCFPKYHQAATINLNDVILPVYLGLIND